MRERVWPSRLVGWLPAHAACPLSQRRSIEQSRTPALFALPAHTILSSLWSLQIVPDPAHVWVLQGRSQGSEGFLALLVPALRSGRLIGSPSLYVSACPFPSPEHQGRSLISGPAVSSVTCSVPERGRPQKVKGTVCTVGLGRQLWLTDGKAVSPQDAGGHAEPELAPPSPDRPPRPTSSAASTPASLGAPRNPALASP